MREAWGLKTLGRSRAGLRSRCLTGVYLGANHVAVAEVQRLPGQAPRLLRATSQPLRAGQSAAVVLAGLLDGGKQPLNLLLPPDHYQLLLVEAPPVMASEMRQAVRWRLGSLIDFDPRDAMVDVLSIPGQRSHSQNMIYVVAAPTERLRHSLASLPGGRQRVQSIDITDMALRNLAARLEDDQRGLATLYLGQQRGLLILTCQGNLHLSRRLDFGNEDIHTNPAEAFKQIALEVQRSLDYYDSHFDSPPIVALALLPCSGQQALLRSLDEQLDLRVYPLATDHLIETTIDLPAHDSAELMLAIGAALRDEGSSE